MFSRCILLLLVLGLISCQRIGLRTTCNSQLTCSSCIAANPDCVWCPSGNFTSNSPRCYGNDDPSQTCPDGEQDPEGKELSRTEETFGDSVQISPSFVHVQVRPQEPVTFSVRVRPASNFPIDLYLLMDLSFSMNNDLITLKNLATTLATEIQKLSTNYRIGFGSFVDKTLWPYTRPGNPCPSTSPCEPTYSYRHAISLTQDSQFFQKQVDLQNISGNVDTPEGGFDGLLQSILCTNLTGWRPVSRKLLLFITDAGFHFAGDGKLGGVVRPYPNTCRMSRMPGDSSSSVLYMDSELYDYPSVGQIAAALREREIIPIFAATNDRISIYSNLARELGQGASVGILRPDSANVVDLVTDQYNTISQRVLFEPQPVPGVSVQVRPKNCPGSTQNGVCNGLPIGVTATFDATVTVSECTPDLLAGPQRLTVRAIGFGSFDILISAICRCDCESTQFPNSSECSGNGTLSCGTCECNPGNFGDRCQCDALNQGMNIQCPVGTTNEQCSGRGTCTCGICNCQSNFFGPACECDQRDCINQDNGLVCSGQGTCGCNGQCMCNIEPFSGLKYNGDLGLCECTPNDEGCRDPADRTEICNGRGTCGCDGTCQCSNNFYFGQYCELCSGSNECLETNCESNRACANCILNITAPKAANIPTADFFKDASNLPTGSNITMDTVNNVIQGVLPREVCAKECPSGAAVIDEFSETMYLIDDLAAVRCEEVRDDCTYQYFVAIVGRVFTAVHVTYDRSCPQPRASVAPWIIAIGIIIPLLVLGIIALILVKVALLIIDYVEVKKFEKELAAMKYSKNENPLYQSAAKDYNNPIYGK